MVEETEVQLPYAAEPLTLSVGDKVSLPIESTDDIDGKSTEPNGTIKWLGILPTISEKQWFAGIETDKEISSSCCDGAYGVQYYFTCSKGHGLFLPVEYAVRHSTKTIKETITPAYYMNTRPHGIALVISLENDSIDSKHFEETFEYLQYAVQHHTSISEMMKLVEAIDHTNYDSFVCCISSGGDNYRAKEIEEADIYKLVNKVERSPSLNGKPKLFFIQCSRVDSSHSSYDIGPDVFVAWSNHKGNASHYDSKGGSCFVKALKRVFKYYAKDINLVVMMEKVSAIISMSLSTQTDTVGQCCAVESKLKKKVFFLSNFDYSRLLDRAHNEGYVTVKWTKVTLSGPPATGKSSVMNLLFGLSFPDTTSSKLRPIETTCLMSVKEQPGPWNKVDYESLKAKVAQAMKEEHRSHSPMLTAVEGQSSDETPKQNNKPSNEATPRSPSIKEITQLLPAVKKSNELYQAHWIYVIDSGGQAAFLDIAPALLHYNLINIIPLKLNKKLKEDKPEFYFDVKGQLIPEPEERQMTHLQLIESSFRSLASRDPPDFPCDVHTDCSYKNPHLLVLGIYFDKITESNESLVEKDAILWKTLEQFGEVRLNYRETREKVIFPINAIGRGKEEINMANLIRNRICQSYIEAKIPVRWFLFQLDLDYFQKTTKTMIISKSECLRIGKALKMDSNDVDAALMYYHDLTIFLYFHEVLRDVVFLHPQPLFNKLSELISISFADAVDHLQDEGILLPPFAHKKMKAEGTFKRELLNSLKDGFSPMFTADNFLELMEHVFILVKMNNDEYFFPIALPITADTESLRAPYKGNVDPLVLTWDKSPLPPGLFSALVINLLSRKVSPMFKLLQPSKSPKGFFQFRNAIQLDCIGPGGAVLLVDAAYWLEIHYSDNPKKCLVIRTAIEEGIKVVAKQFHYKPIDSDPQEHFHCTMHKTDPIHLCRPNEDHTSLSCGTSSANIDHVRQLPWLYSIANNPNKDNSAAIFKQEPDTCKLLGLLTEINYLWDKIGVSLQVKNNIIGSLHRSSKDDSSKLYEILQKWKESKSSPVTWENIITEVEGPIVGNFKRIADKIREHLISQ